MRLGERTWTEVERTTVLVPVGSLEQHGPHLPLDTDARIAAAVARRAADPSTLIAPPLAYGASGEHEGFAGTLSIGHAALRAVLVELGRSAGAWASRLVFVNGHGGNLPTVAEAAVQLRAEGRDVAWSGCVVPGGDAHAGRTETSILLALDPSVVRLDAAEVGNTAPLQDADARADQRWGAGGVRRTACWATPAGRRRPRARRCWRPSSRTCATSSAAGSPTSAARLR